MTDERFEKDFGPADTVRERTGIYGLGFDPDSAKGFMLPFIIVFAFGVVGAALIWYFL
jgi:hypothetical protein